MHVTLVTKDQLLASHPLFEIARNWGMQEWGENGDPVPLEVQALACLIAEGTPVGCALLTLKDLTEKPEIYPWLANVYVVPEFRGRGGAKKLVCAIEEEARRQRFSHLWLYYEGTRALYARLGWVPWGLVPTGTKLVSLMTKELDLS